MLQAGLLSCQATYLYYYKSILSFCFCLSGCVSAKFYFLEREDFLFFSPGGQSKLFCKLWFVSWHSAVCKCACFTSDIA